MSCYLLLHAHSSLSTFTRLENGFEKPRFIGFKKPENIKSPNFRSVRFCAILYRLFIFML